LALEDHSDDYCKASNDQSDGVEVNDCKRSVSDHTRIILEFLSASLSDNVHITDLVALFVPFEEADILTGSAEVPGHVPVLLDLVALANLFERHVRLHTRIILEFL
jgi:nitrate reductase assembly molybdenum cofactor insertion protein NarJ